MFTSTGSQFFRKAALCALTISSLVNLLAIRSIQKGPTVDDSAYSYIGDDFPTELPIVLDTVEMVFEDFAPDGHFSQTGLNSWLEWHAVDYFPRAHGFVSLGPQGRQFGVSMFHQLHCLEMLRESMINGPDGHAAHCLNFLRQAILCNADHPRDGEGDDTYMQGLDTGIRVHQTKPDEL